MATHITCLRQNLRIVFAACTILVSAASHSQTPPNTTPPAAPIANDNAAEMPQNTGAPNNNAPAPTADLTTQLKVEPKPLAPAQSYFQTPARQQALLAMYIASPLGGGQTVWLDVNGQSLLAIWHPETSGTPKGAALLLPNQSSTPNGPQPITNLQEYLNNNGWATLALALPAPNPILPPPVTPIIALAAPPAKDPLNNMPTANGNLPKEEPPTTNEKNVVHKDAEEQTNEAAKATPDAVKNNADTSTPDATAESPTSAPLPAVEPIALASITAGLQHMQNLGQFNNVIIAEGLSAARTLYFLESIAKGEVSLNAAPAETIQNHPLRAVILINAEHQLAEIPAFDALKIINTLPISVFDVYYLSSRQSASGTLLKLAKQRKQAAQTGSPPIYISRQILPAATGLKGETRLTRVIRGFLHQHAEGVETPR